MQFEELWEEVERKNPQIRKGKVTMSSDNFKKALRYAFNKGSVQENYFDEYFKGMRG